MRSAPCLGDRKEEAPWGWETRLRGRIRYEVSSQTLYIDGSRKMYEHRKLFGILAHAKDLPGVDLWIVCEPLTGDAIQCGYYHFASLCSLPEALLRQPRLQGGGLEICWPGERP